MTNHVFIATSLDGYIATSDGGIEWLNEIPNPDQSDYGFVDFINGVDAIIMGRKTYEKVLSFKGDWPYVKPVFVLSNTLTTVPGELKGKVEIVKGNIRSIIGTLNERGYQNFYIDGGQTIHSFLEADMIDEMIITRISILLGKGIPLFRDMKNSLKFKHVETIAYNENIVKGHYRRA